jgi:hypothetical protein
MAATLVLEETIPDPSEYGNMVVPFPEVQSFAFTELPN